MIEIDVNGLEYFSYLDEESFFHWAENIDCVVSVAGGIFIVDPNLANEMNLRDLLALLHRYQLPMHALKPLLNDSNKKWFSNNEAYWHEGVFNHA